MKLLERSVELFETPPPQISCAEAERILLEHYGIEAEATLLYSERDRNFRMALAEGRRLLLKITSEAEETSATHLQTQALQYLARQARHLPVPRLVAAQDGSVEINVIAEGGSRHIVRLMSYLPGDSASVVPKSSEVRRAIFRALAELDRNLCGFEPTTLPTSVLLWDVSRAERARSFATEITCQPVRNATLRALDRYAQHVRPRLRSLRRQMIHNDFNPNNILLSPVFEVSGIIDFGDMLRAPLVGDLATGAAYQMIGVPDSIQALCECAAAYHQSLALLPEEIEILYDLTIARLVLIVAITEWRAKRHPKNSAYILRNTPKAAQTLLDLIALDRDQVVSHLRQALRAGT